MGKNESERKKMKIYMREEIEGLTNYINPKEQPGWWFPLIFIIGKRTCSIWTELIRDMGQNMLDQFNSFLFESTIQAKMGPTLKN